MTADEAIFHITTPDAWAAAQEAGEVVPESLATEGFVHCSTASQLDGTIARHFAGAAALVVLRLRRDLLDDELRWEQAGHGGSYPHLYRPISVSEVAEAIPR
jgi:uncharacterized protein (DUF952 family)